MSVRLDRAVSEGFLLSRSDAKKAIRQGRVTVSGRPAADPAAKVEDGAALLLDGQAPLFGPMIYLMMNKPEGYLSATEDGRDKTVFDLLPQGLRRAGLGVCGRLDKDSRGMLLLMNDGQLNHRLTSPRHHAEKVYLVGLDAPATADDAEAFAAGVPLADFTAAPAVLEIDPACPARCRVTLREGKYHQIKRMFAARGKHVVSLERLSMAGICLDSALAPGQFRPLNQAEIDALMTAVGILTKKT